MPNLYATATEIKAALPDAIRAGQTKYDAELLRLASQVARFIDNYCQRVFHPTVATRYPYVRGHSPSALRLDDLLSVTSVAVSQDDGQTYTALADSDYFLTVEGDESSPKSWTHLHLDANGAWSYWPRGQRSVKVVGVWGYADDRDAAWEDSTDEVENNPLAAGDTSLTVNDVNGSNLWGLAPRFQAGQLYRIESEFIEATDTDQQAAVNIARGRNGTTAAEHAQNTAIDIWRPPEPVKQAVIQQLVRGFMRALQGYGDGRASPESSQIIWTRALDPDVVSLLAPYVVPVHA